jgi:plastocyanin
VARVPFVTPESRGSERPFLRSSRLRYVGTPRPWRMAMRRLHLLLLIGALLAGAACGSSEAAGGGSKPAEEDAPVGAAQEEAAGRHADCTMLTQQQFVELTAVDSNAFAPDCVVMKTDAMLKVRNVGFREHTVTISKDEFGTAPWIFNIEIKGGKTVDSVEPVGEFLEPGIYEFFCKFHAGMDGTLEVVEPIS